MEPNDYWTHVGLAVSAFVVVVLPRLFAAGHTVNSLIYIGGAIAVIGVASLARRYAKS